MRKFKLNVKKISGASSREIETVYYTDLETGLVWWDFENFEEANAYGCLTKYQPSEIRENLEKGKWFFVDWLESIRENLELV